MAKIGLGEKILANRLQGLLTGVEITIKLWVSLVDDCYGSGLLGKNGLFFDNLVVTTSILIFQPVEDWKKIGCRS